MKILLVEDNPDDSALCRLGLSRLGYQVVAAGTGPEAISLYERERPDVVLTDIYLPGMDGFEVTRAIQQRAAPRWQPVIFISGYRDDDLEVRALQAGADGYVVKPVPASVLDARLQVIQRLLILQRQAEGRADELARYYALEEEEQRIAQHLVERLVDRQRLDDAAVRHWQLPAAALHGDLLAAARTPSGVLHLLLANGTGQGLVASINALPLPPPFYRMTEKGFGIDTIARELNSKIRQFLPPNCTVAATLASLDAREGVVQVWNGGNPEPFLLDPAGGVARVFSQSHQPLGALDDTAFSADVEAHAILSGSQFIMFSDGLLAAADPAGNSFGHQRLADCVVGTPASQRFDGIVSSLKAHLAGGAAADDISLMLVDCQEVPRRPRIGDGTAHPAPGAAAGANWRFSLRLGGRELATVDVVPLLLGLAGQVGGVGEKAGQLFVLLAELFNNALDHGLLRMDSRLKLQPGGMETWIEERAQRLAALGNDQQIEIELEHVRENGKPWLRLVCTDSGPGFAVGELPAGEADSLPFGRGIALVRAIGSRVQYNEAGNSVVVLLEIGEGMPVAASI